MRFEKFFIYSVGMVAISGIARAGTPLSPVYIYNDAELAGNISGNQQTDFQGTVRVNETLPVSGGYASGSATSNVSLLPNPYLASSVVLNDPSPLRVGQEGSSAIGSNQLEFSLMISGPNPSAIVPVDLFASDTLSVTAVGNVDSFAEAYIEVLYGVNTLALYNNLEEIDAAGIISSSPPIPKFSTLSLQTGTQYVVYYGANSSCNNNSYLDSGVGGSGSASASLDPYFQIDPSFADASQYTLNISPGVGNASTPAPAAIIPFVLGVLARRRRAPKAAV